MLPLIQVQNLKVSFINKNETIHAVQGISFEVFVGESLGIVGESGCGKTSAIQAITGLSPKAVIEGTAYFEGIDLIKKSDQALGKKIGVVFQDPMTSLNPTMKIRAQIAEGMIYHGFATRSESRIKALKLLELVGIPDVALRAEQYPHELSGGQRQRVAIAIALACNPRLLIADEPTTALDVTIQAQIIGLIQQIQKQLRMSLILISHDLRVVAQVCDRILVFYAGKIVEQGTVKEIFQTPRHPYTQMLLQALPSTNQPKSKPLRIIEGTAPSLKRIHSGCPFSERCPYVTQICEKKEPPFFGTAACWKNQ
jgi:oligopeptide transport system ATP-binding protein